MADRVRVATAFHSPFYTPAYLAHRLGHFAEEGLDVTITSPARAGGTVDMLSSGEVELAVSGAMRSYVAFDRGESETFLSIGEVNSRDGFFLLSRSPAPGFAWRDLAGRSLILFAEAPTPWMCLQEVLRGQGVDPASVKVVPGLALPQAVAAFRAGQADFLQTGQPVVEELVEEGAAHIAAAMAPAVGKLPYSSLMVTHRFRQERPELCRRAVRALARVQRWMAGRDGAEFADVIAQDFPAIRPAILRKVLARYHAAGTWPDRPFLERAPFERLGRILVDGGLIRRAAPFDTIADNTFAGDE